MPGGSTGAYRPRGGYGTTWRLMARARRNLRTLRHPLPSYLRVMPGGGIHFWLRTGVSSVLKCVTATSKQYMLLLSRNGVGTLFVEIRFEDSDYLSKRITTGRAYACTVSEGCHNQGVTASKFSLKGLSPNGSTTVEVACYYQCLEDPKQLYRVHSPLPTSTTCFYLQHPFKLCECEQISQKID